MESHLLISTHCTRVDGTWNFEVGVWLWRRLWVTFQISINAPFQVGTSQRYPSIPLYITVNEPLKGHEKDLILDIEEELVFGGPSASWAVWTDPRWVAAAACLLSWESCPCTPSRRDAFYFQLSSFDFFPVTWSFFVTGQAGRPVPTRNCYFTVPNSTSRGASVTTLSSWLLKYLYGHVVPSTRVKWVDMSRWDSIYSYLLNLIMTCLGVCVCVCVCV